MTMADPGNIVFLNHVSSTTFDCGKILLYFALFSAFLFITYLLRGDLLVLVHGARATQRS